MELGLNEKVAIVGASSKGLGRAIALGLAKEGVRVCVNGRHSVTVKETAESIARETGSETLAVPGDLTDEATIERLVKLTVERWGGIDILVTNAGGPPAGEFLELDDEAWQNAFQLNLLTVVRLIRAAVPEMRRRGSGRIINLTSTSVVEPIPNLILSNSIRAAVIGMAKTLSQELARDNILVNNVAPGRIATDRVAYLDADRAQREGKTIEQVQQEREAAIPLRRYGLPEELANVVVFLASERASYITGATIPVEGGLLRSI